MRKAYFLSVLVLPMLLAMGTTTSANDHAGCCDAAPSCDAGCCESSCCESSCCDSCFSNCCRGCGNGLIFAAEATFFRFHEATGVEDGQGSDAEFDFEASPRITLGFVNCNGRGARLRWWDYDHDTQSDRHRDIEVDTYNIDLEVFQVIDLPCCVTLDLSAGIRYNEFYHFYESEGSNSNDEHAFSGIHA